MTALQSLLDSLPSLTLVVGKGGTGKTTVSAGVAAHLARRGHRTLVLSTDPAGTLGDALGASLGPKPQPIANVPNLDACQLVAAVERNEFLARWRDVIATIIDRGTYLDASDIDGLVDAALPGADEVFALLALASLLRESTYDRIVVDTAPTGHTLRLLALPRTFDALIALLDTMQQKHRFMVQALTHRYRRDRADEFLDEMRSSIGSLRAALQDSQRSGALVIGRPETVVAAETTRLVGALGGAEVGIVAVIVNAMPIDPGEEARKASKELASLAPSAPHYAIPRLALATGIASASSVMEGLAVSEPSRAVPSAPMSKNAPLDRRGSRDIEPTLARRLGRPLTIVGGKGGVGKTTVSCAVALAAAEEGDRVLLVSTDPAPSIADALGEPIGDAETKVPGVRKGELYARQMDAAAAFQRFRSQYETRVDALFAALIGRGVDATYDRAIVRDLLALTPPGIDELYALSSLGETLADASYARVIVDPAPTGHLLRLLEMPALALDWSRQLMRLMLKYKEIVGLGETAQELLDFSRRTRTLEGIFKDHSRAGLVAVALDEPLVRGETERLVAAVRELGVDVIALVWNRADTSTRPLPSIAPLEQLVTPERQPPPVGIAALRDWSHDWISLSLR